jgi:hypothetical protein
LLKTDRSSCNRRFRNFRVETSDRNSMPVFPAFTALKADTCKISEFPHPPLTFTVRTRTLHATPAFYMDYCQQYRISVRENQHQYLFMAKKPTCLMSRICDTQSLGPKRTFRANDVKSLISFSAAIRSRFRSQDSCNSRPSTECREFGRTQTRPL